MKSIWMLSIIMMNMLVMLFSKMSESEQKKKEKKMSFECGFNMMSPKKTTFSTNFLMLMMMFLIFDVEVSVLIPYVTMNKMSQKTIMVMALNFIVVLTALILKEWSEGSLEWSQ